MEKKGMLYKRTFSAAASALMVLSACAPMSVFADEQEFDIVNENSDFDVIPESETKSQVYLNTNFETGSVKAALDKAAQATDNKNDAKEELLTSIAASNKEEGDIFHASIRTLLGKNRIGNKINSTEWNKDTKECSIKGSMTLDIDLKELLALEGYDLSLIRSAENAFNNLKEVMSAPNILDEYLTSGTIEFTVTLPSDIYFSEKISDSSGQYPSHLVKIAKVEKVAASPTQAKVTLTLNEGKQFKDLIRVVKGNGNYDSISVELPYEGTYSYSGNGPRPGLQATVKVEGSKLFTATRARKTLNFNVNANEHNTTKFDLKENLKVSETVKPEKPSKPSGTLTGGYPSSKPGNSTSTSSVRAMYRLYNPKTAEHFYTQSAEERDNLVRGGWNNEGIGWHAPTGSSTPVYRVFNPNSGDHHYTTNLEEYQTLTRIGWNAEGIGWYSESNKGAPIYRLYNKTIKVGSHHYTQNAAERDKLVNEGWVYEGIAWYAVK